jgi:hypothetical protein
MMSASTLKTKARTCQLKPACPPPAKPDLLNVTGRAAFTIVTLLELQNAFEVITAVSVSPLQ